MQYRYYIGLQLPPELNAHIIEAQRALFDDAHMVEPLEPHITLLPPPAVERIEPEELARQCKITAQPLLPLKLTVTQVEPFKDYVIVLAVESAEIHQLQQQLIQLLPPDVEMIYYPNPKFSPHITLAQAKRGMSLAPELPGKYAHRLAKILPVEFEATHLTLFTWKAQREYTAHPLV